MNTNQTCVRVAATSSGITSWFSHCFPLCLAYVIISKSITSGFLNVNTSKVFIWKWLSSVFPCIYIYPSVDSNALNSDFVNTPLISLRCARVCNTYAKHDNPNNENSVMTGFSLLDDLATCLFLSYQMTKCTLCFKHSDRFEICRRWNLIHMRALGSYDAM